MSQQVNLYSPLFRKQKKLFTAIAMLQAMLLVIAGLAVFYTFSRLQVIALERQARQLDQRVKVGVEQLKTFAESQPAAQDPKLAEARIAELEARLRATQNAASRLGDAGGSARYTEYLRALARHSVSGVWLTSVSVEGDSGELSLTGRALRPDLVAQYIEKLRQDPSLRGRSFAELSIENPRPGAKPEPGAQPYEPKAVEFKLLSARSGDR